MMTQEDKELLLKDLCARLQYGVKMNHIADSDIEPTTLIGIAKNMITLEGNGGYATTNIEEFKPYLFPFSSMTEEHRLEIEILTNGQIAIDKYSLWDLSGCSELSLSQTLEVFDWLNKNHFDYRGLIEKGFAIDATGLNIY